ncbi:hypothetical protein L7F22_040338 [Adiantum nelumboides]|nr:hypothetical protein [Adiantum nelumboides]
MCSSLPAITNRTQGIEIRAIMKDGIQLSLWDMAGQQEFHAFHDYMFPDLSTTFGSPAIFMYVWSPIESKDGSKGEQKTIRAFEASFGYWLKFIASKTRQSNVARKVIVVFTRKDQMSLVFKAVSASLKALTSKFQQIIQVVEVFEVDARDQACVKPVASCIFNTAREILEGVEVYHICTQVSKRLSFMLKASSKQKLIINWSEFRDVCKREFNIDESEVQKAIACSLNDSGDVIYMSNMGYLVLDPNWFCHEIMGSLIYFPESLTSNAMSIHGYVQRQYLESLLEDVSNSRVKGSLLVDLLEAMHLSCDVADGTVFIPATLSDHSSAGHHAQWRGENTWRPTEYAYMGRRLECDKKEVTFLTPGLFPMIQEEHVIDVMVRAPHQADMAEHLAYVEEEVIRTLIRVCAQPVGIQGVKLMEGVLRPDCLREPAAPHVREDQCVSLYDLKQSLRKQLQEGRRPEQLVYLWKENQHVKSSRSSFIDLLGYDGYAEMLMLYKASLIEASRMAAATDEYARHAAASTSEESSKGRKKRPAEHEQDVGYGDADQSNRMMMMVASYDTPLHEQARGSKRFPLGKEGEPIVDMFSRGMARAIFEEINAKLDGLHSKMDSMHKDLQSGLSNIHEELVSLRSDVLPKIAKTVEKSLHFAVESEAGKVPRFVFLTTDKIGVTRKLVTSLIKGLHSVRIELFCEHRLLPHRVDGQKGIVLTSIDDTSLLHDALPYANGFLTLLTLVAKVGANVVAGAGSAVPDLSASCPLKTVINIPSTSVFTPLKNLGGLGMQSKDLWSTLNVGENLQQGFLAAS